MRKHLVTVLVLAGTVVPLWAVDTARSRGELQTIFADGQPAGSITPQDMRDYVVSIVPATKTEGRLLRFGAANAAGQTAGLYEDGSGNVAIGETSPDAALEILSITSPQLKITHSDGVDDVDFSIDANGDFDIQISGDNFVIQNDVDGTTGVQILDADGGVPILNIDTTNERVGVAMASPAYPLDVTGNAGFSASIIGTANALTLVGGTSTTADLNLKTTTGVGITGADMHFLVGNNGGTEALTILNSGNVGVGTTAPASRLNVANTTAVNVDIISDSDANGSDEDATLRFLIDGVSGTGTQKGKIGYDQGADVVSLGYGALNSITINSSQNIGLGTVTQAPRLLLANNARTLEISATTGGEFVIDHSDAAGTSHIGALTFARLADDIASVYAVADGAIDAGRLAFYTQATAGANTERVRITSAGIVAIGTTDTDGTPIRGKTTIKGETNDGSTYPLVLRDSDEVNILQVNSNGIVSLYNTEATAAVGQPYIRGSASVEGRTTAITTTNTVASAAVGTYRVTGYLHTTTASTGACTSDITIGWTNDISAETSEVVSNHDQNTDNNNSHFTITLHSDAAANITHAVSLDAGGGDCSNAEFDFYVVAERLQ